VNVRGYSIDSRTINAGELFFAIKGPRFDGHEFVAQALQKGAAAAVVEEELRPSPGPPAAASPSPSGRGQGEGSIIRVTSTLEALQTLALTVRRRLGMTIIGVTGSAGKTTTKEMTAAVLGKKFTVLRSAGNLNNEFGMPLCLLRAERYQNFAVREMGMSNKYRIWVSKEPLSPCSMARAMHISFCLCSASTMSPMRSPPSPWALHTKSLGNKFGKPLARLSPKKCAVRSSSFAKDLWRSM